MKRIENNLICGLGIIALLASGCSGISSRVTPNFAGRDDSTESVLATPDPGNFQEIWVIERNANATNTSPHAPAPSSLKAMVHGEEQSMPLKRMDVTAAINDYIGTVDVRQQFENPYAEKIEVVYAFTLPAEAVVDDFVMTIGKRRIRGIIRERKVAEAIYRQAGHLGYLASLFSADQTNTFRQTIANVEPGKNIDVNIHYFQALRFEDGWFEFLFPMVSNSGGSQNGKGVPVSLHIDVNSSAPIANLQCPGYAAVKKSPVPEHWSVELSSSDTIPNQDFQLRYRLVDSAPQGDLMTYRDERGGYFTLLLHPPNESSLTNVKIDWGAMQVSEIYPGRFADIPPGGALMVAGRFSGSGSTAVTVSATAGNQPVSYSIPLDLTRTGSEKSIPKVWASMKIAKLAREWYEPVVFESIRNIKQVALDYGLVSPFTSFLAVDASEPTN